MFDSVCSEYSCRLFKLVADVLAGRFSMARRFKLGMSLFGEVLTHKVFPPSLNEAEEWVEEEEE